jgi:hypothetical protein
LIGGVAPVSDAEAEANLASLHALQSLTGPLFRHRVGSVVAVTLNKVLPPQPVTDEAVIEAAQTLATEGCVQLGQVLSDNQVADIVQYARSKPCFNAHVAPESDHVPRLLGQGAEAFHYGSYSAADVVLAPHLIELANSPRIRDLAAFYLGCTPTIYSMNIWWSFSSHGEAPIAQHFHRDADDYRFCTLFVYLTDADETNGAHVYLRRTHDPDACAGEIQGRNLTLEDVFPSDWRDPRPDVAASFSGNAVTINGPKGFAFMTDPAGLHKGLPLQRGSRLVAWVRFGLYRNQVGKLHNPNPVRSTVLGSRLPKDEATRYVFRCLVAD